LFSPFSFFEPVQLREYAEFWPCPDIFERVHLYVGMNLTWRLVSRPLILELCPPKAQAQSEQWRAVDFWAHPLAGMKGKCYDFSAGVAENLMPTEARYRSVWLAQCIGGDLSSTGLGVSL
jgi:hypothetical protein